MALHREWIGSPNYSSRGGAGVRLVVIHTAEGARTYRELGNYFANPASGVSSHTGIDDTAGVIGEYVSPSNKAWTQGNANPVSVAAELCAFASWSPAEWDRHPAMLLNCAEWVAEECRRYGLPIRRLSASEAQGNGRGVCQHVDLGSWGGNHWDCGPGFPMDDVIARAATGAPAPAEDETEMTMTLGDAKSGGVWVAYPDGAVHAVGGAPYLGGTNNTTSGTAGHPCIGIAASGDGYLLVHEFGSGNPGSRDPRTYHFRR